MLEDFGIREKELEFGYLFEPWEASTLTLLLHLPLCECYLNVCDVENANLIHILILPCIPVCCCDMPWGQCQWRRENLSLYRLILKYRILMCSCGRLDMKTVSLKRIQRRLVLVRDSQAEWSWTCRIDLSPSETLKPQTLDIWNYRSSTASGPHAEDSMWLSQVKWTIFILTTICEYFQLKSL